MRVSEDLCHFQYLEYYLKCLVWILKVYPTNLLYEGLSRFVILIPAHLGFTCKTSKVLCFVNILKGPEKGKKKIKTWTLLHQSHQWNAGRSDSQIYRLSMLQHCGTQVLFQSIRRLDFGKLYPKNPASSWCWPKAVTINSKTFCCKTVNSLGFIKSGFAEYPLSMFLF